MLTEKYLRRKRLYSLYYTYRLEFIEKVVIDLNKCLRKEYILLGFNEDDNLYRKIKDKKSNTEVDYVSLTFNTIIDYGVEQGLMVLVRLINDFNK